MDVLEALHDIYLFDLGVREVRESVITTYSIDLGRDEFGRTVRRSITHDSDDDGIFQITDNEGAWHEHKSIEDAINHLREIEHQRRMDKILLSYLNG